MGLLDEERTAELEREDPTDKTNKWLVVIAVVTIGFLYSMWMVRVGIAGSFPEQALASALGSTTALLILPTIVGLIARARGVRKWHYGFGATFAVILFLHVVGSSVP